MRWTGIFVASLMTAAPMVASAQVALDRPHQLLGEGVQRVVQGHYVAAEQKLREALREDPNLREGYYNLAVALKNEGRFDEAIAEYAEAAKLYAHDEAGTAKCLYGQALAKEARGDKDAWDLYLAYAKPLRAEQPAVQIAHLHQEQLEGVKVPGGYQKASR